jgi:citronellol/citronellal dehydrogenase
MATLKDKTIFVTGGSRGIGRAIALKFATDGANIVIASKTSDSHPSLPGTIHTVADEIRQLGSQALAVQLDTRDDSAIQRAIEKTVQTFGGLDILINNASAISPTGVLDTPAKRYDLLQSVNTRGTYLCAHHALPHLRVSKNPHILSLSPPISTDPKWYGRYLAYAISKYGMSMCTLGLAEEFREAGVAANSLWPRTMIATDAVRVHYREEYRRSRSPAIMADAAYLIVTKSSRSFSGHCLIDDDFMKAEGISDLSGYAIDPTVELAPDILID